MSAATWTEELRAHARAAGLPGRIRVEVLDQARRRGMISWGSHRCFSAWVMDVSADGTCWIRSFAVCKSTRTAAERAAVRDME